jgi:hypothetical protein
MTSDHDGWTDPLAGVDTQNAESVIALLNEASDANRNADCREGSIDLVEPCGLLTATGDIHDNPVHFARVMRLAKVEEATPDAPRHVTLHEVIHGVSAMGVDFSHRALLRVAAVKREFPEYVHTLLANHELAQIVGAGIIKDGVQVVEAFNDGVAHVFGDDASAVLEAIADFIRSMPLALVSRTESGGVLCAHSLPSPGMMKQFDSEVLERELDESDYEPRKGSAHLMVWGRSHSPKQLKELAERWNISLFILGHQHTENGWSIDPPNAVILNSDHARGVVIQIDLADPPTPMDAVGTMQPLAIS